MKVYQFSHLETGSQVMKIPHKHCYQVTGYVSHLVGNFLTGHIIAIRIGWSVLLQPAASIAVIGRIVFPTWPITGTQQPAALTTRKEKKEKKRQPPLFSTELQHNNITTNRKIS